MATDASSSAISIRRQLAVAATIAAGAIHLAASVPHYADSAALGIGFTVTGLVQLAVAVAVIVLRGRRRVRAAVTLAAINGAAVGVWALSRTVGLPIGHAGPESLAVPDALTAALELLAVGATLWWVRRPAAASRWTRRAAIAVASGWVLALAGAGVGVAALGTAGHGHADDHDAAGAHGADEPESHDAPEDAAADPSSHDRPAGVDANDVPPTSGQTAPEPQSEPAGDGHTHAPGERH